MAATPRPMRPPDHPANYSTIHLRPRVDAPPAREEHDNDTKGEDTMSDDEYTPREHGLEGGHLWATRFASTSDEIARIASGDIPDDVRAAVEPGVIAGWSSWRPEETRAADLEDFWDGFVGGVRAYTVQVRTGMGQN